ncbi:hypothetical protein ElP_75010 (plasmid) [Tautonia plasticadhaerens]|uniref:Uncharacterized protein n=1 Tax=Tautonia plasticadhaerens TaxID=2527974 RepID=A0A518HFB2_9BACT|nr:hypothetical protein ElP_75010 [Tautonia plasticadhaerens]
MAVGRRNVFPFADVKLPTGRHRPVDENSRLHTPIVEWARPKIEASSRSLCGLRLISASTSPFRVDRSICRRRQLARRRWCRRSSSVSSPVTTRLG